MTSQERLQASIERIGAQRIAEIVPITLQEREGVAGGGPNGITLSPEWVEGAADDMLDAVIVHELMHKAFLSPDSGIRPLMAELKTAPGPGSVLQVDSVEIATLADFAKEFGMLPPAELDVRPTYPTPASWRRVQEIIDAEAERSLH